MISYEDWLSSLKVGDKAIYKCGDAEEVVEVTKLTATQIVTTAGRFYRVRGTNYGIGDGLPASAGHLSRISNHD